MIDMENARNHNAFKTYEYKDSICRGYMLIDMGFDSSNLYAFESSQYWLGKYRIDYKINAIDLWVIKGA